MATKSKNTPTSRKAAPSKSSPSKAPSSATSSGWAVSVTSPPVDGDGPATEETFYAAIPDQMEAEKAVAQLASAPPEATVKADKRISAEEFAKMGWHPGQIEQWVGPSLAAPGA